MIKSLRIAALAGDGIGLEVLPQGIKVVNAVAKKHNIPLHFESFDWASCDYYLKHGKMMPDNWFEVLKDYDAIFLARLVCQKKFQTIFLYGVRYYSFDVDLINMSTCVLFD